MHHKHKHHKARSVLVGNRLIVSHGLEKHFWQDIYHYSMNARWSTFICTIALVFILINLLFASLYQLGENPISNLSPKGFLGAFFFSVETLATVGYGDMHPNSLYAHIVSTIEVFIGMMCVALITGLMFSRFSMPRAMILFSRHPVVCMVDGKQVLMIRTANGRQNVIVEANAKLDMIRNEISANGSSFRRVSDLKLVRDQHPLFTLGWTLIHEIDESSPLYQADENSFRADDCTLVLSMSGIDATIGQPLRARCLYSFDAIKWRYRYVDLFYVDENGVSHLDHSKFDDIVPDQHAK